MTIDEIKEKYQCDRRQTGQNFVTEWGSGASFSSGVGQRLRMSKKAKDDFKRTTRKDNKPGLDPLLKAQKDREIKALKLKIENKKKTVKALIEEISKVCMDLENKYNIVAFPFTEIKDILRNK